MYITVMLAQLLLRSHSVSLEALEAVSLPSPCSFHVVVANFML